MNQTTSNIAEYTVTEISSKIKRTVEDAYGYVRVRGELGRVSRPSSGHVYLDLKDDKSVLSGVIWKGVAQVLNIQPEQGLEVIATGKITTFAGQSKYQIVIDSIEPAGLGALLAQLEKRKKELEAEGLFAEENKKPLPLLPKVIGVVSSPSGVVINDIWHRIQERFPLHVLIWPVTVQGEKCPQEVVAAIKGFNAMSPDEEFPRPDIIIVARGGGSVEDLWGYNDESVVRAVADSEIPLISAIGHDPDWTLIDYAADVRAPTPTAAAEIATQVKYQLEADVDNLSHQLQTSLNRLLQEQRMRFRILEKAMPQQHDLLALPRQKFDSVADKLGYALRSNTHTHRMQLNTIRGRLSINNLIQTVKNSRKVMETSINQLRRTFFHEIRRKQTQFETVENLLSTDNLIRTITQNRTQLSEIQNRIDRSFTMETNRKRAQLETQSKLLWTLSYQSVLDRGFVLVRDMKENPVRLAADISAGQALNIQFKDGRVNVTANDQDNAKNDSEYTEIGSKPKSDSPETDTDEQKQGILI